MPAVTPTLSPTGGAQARGQEGRAGEDQAVAVRGEREPRAVEGVEVPAGLHLKTGLTALGDGTLVASAPFAAAAAIRDLGPLLVTPEGEEAGANLLPLGEHLVLAAGCPGLRAAVARRAPGLTLHEVDLSEFHKVDGMITCLSLVW